MKSKEQNCEQYQQHKQGKHTDNERNCTSYCILVVTHGLGHACNVQGL